jgi:hypothetical protein
MPRAALSFRIFACSGPRPRRVDPEADIGRQRLERVEREREAAGALDGGAGRLRVQAGVRDQPRRLGERQRIRDGGGNLNSVHRHVEDAEGLIQEVDDIGGGDGRHIEDVVLQLRTEVRRVAVAARLLRDVLEESHHRHAEPCLPLLNRGRPSGLAAANRSTQNPTFFQ